MTFVPFSRMLRFTVVLAAILFALLPALPAVAGGSAEWSSRGSSSWADATDDADPVLEQSAEEAVTPETVEPLPTPEASPEPPGPPAVSAVLTPGIVFPVAGPATYTNSFGAPRSGGRSHEGIDIFADKMIPVVAVADGTVTFVRNGVGTDCCVIRVRHADGQSSLYLHLNNDNPGTDDGQGFGIAEGIDVGTPVVAGMVIGYVGDSGNAEDTPPHLHFELEGATGSILNPYAYLQIAQGAEPALFASALNSSLETLPETGLPISSLFLASMGLLVGGAALAGRPGRGRLGRRRSLQVSATPCDTAAWSRCAGQPR